MIFNAVADCVGIDSGKQFERGLQMDSRAETRILLIYKTAPGS